MREIQQPTVEHRSSPGIEEDIVRHPAFAQIAVSRVSGGAMLYGSDFQHQHFVRVTIRASELHRSLSRDWAMGGKTYIEVDLSEAQWAEFVSSFNVGMGVQCTLVERNHEMIPGLPKPERRIDQFEGEARETLGDALKHLDKLVEQINEMKISQKQKDQLIGHIRMSRQELVSNLPFVLK
jgi:hypothetical protein